MEDGADDSTLQQHLEILAADRIAPPLIVNDPGILHLLDAIAIRGLDEDGGTVSREYDLDLLRAVQGSKLIRA
jgi:hypothetical protein